MKIIPLTFSVKRILYVPKSFYIVYSTRLKSTNSQTERICNLFQCTVSKGKKLAKSNPSFFHDIDHVYKVVNDLKNLGVSPETLMKHINIFDVPTEELNFKLDTIKQWKVVSPPLTLSILGLPRRELESLSNSIGKKLCHKVKSFSLLLNCSEEEATDYFFKHKFLLRSSINTLKRKVDVLTDGGMLKEELVKDLWILSYTCEKLEERLKIANRLNLTPLKPWLLRCHESVLHRKWIVKEENEAALSPYKSTEDFLCQKLNMGPSEMKSFSKKHPPVMRVKVAKMKEILDFLLSEGFTTAQIYNTPRIFCHSLNTIQTRLNVLREQRFEPFSLSVLCKSTKGFTETVRKLSRGF